MTFEIRETTPEDIRIVADNMRTLDEVEVLLLTKKPPYEALCESVSGSIASYCGYFDGIPGGIFGISKMNDEVGIPWMLGTDRMTQHSREWMSMAPMIVDLMHDQFPVLTNVVYEKNYKSIRWLHRLGFEFSPLPVPGHPGFIQFYRRKNV